MKKNINIKQIHKPAVIETQSLEDLYKKLDIDPKIGVLESDIERRRTEFGQNKVSLGKTRGFFWYFLEQFKNPLNLILIAAGILTFFLGEILDTYVIFASVLVNIFISVFQESRTNKTFQKLNKLKAFDVLVRRDSGKTVIQAEDLVLGDIVFLQAGNKIPADITILEQNNLFIDESSFTGEAESVAKKMGDFAYSGSIVKKGSAIGICIAVGKDSKFGQILSELNEIKKKPSAIAEKMKRVSILVGSIAIFAIVLVIIAGVYSGLPLYTLIVLGISVAISAIPEGLGASVSAALSVGMHRLLKKGVLVKDLTSAETMASIDTILTDKTGTLTEGDMTLKDVFLNNKENLYKMKFMEQAYLASDVSYDFKNKQFVGDEMDVAIANELESEHLFSAGYYQDLEDKFEILKILPFSSEKKFFAKLVKEKETGKNFIFVKGAPEIILENSINISTKDLKQFEDILKNGQDAETRFLAFGYKELNESQIANRESLDLNLVDIHFTGFASFLDPLKKSVKEVLQTVKNMDLDLIMITGDSKEIAAAVALKSGLISYEQAEVLEGKDIENMTKDELYIATKTVKVFARVSPKDKLKLAETLIEHGHRIAMTGDGVNDVLALSQADIGISFANASEAAREAASLVLEKNDFSLILLAIDEARNIIKNIRKTVVYLLSSSFSEVLVIFGALILGGPMPFLAVHILWANIVEEGLINFAFIFGKNKKDKKGGKISSKILTKKIKKMMALLGIFDGISLLALYIFLWKFGFSDIKIQSLMFLALSLNFLFIAYALTDMEKPIIKTGIFSNKYLNFSVLAGLSLISVAIFWEPVRSLLHLEPFRFKEIFYLLLFSLSSLPVIETLKYFLFYKKGK